MWIHGEKIILIEGRPLESSNPVSLGFKFLIGGQSSYRKSLQFCTTLHMLLPRDYHSTPSLFALSRRAYE